MGRHTSTERSGPGPLTVVILALLALVVLGGGAWMLFGPDSEQDTAGGSSEAATATPECTDEETVAVWAAPSAASVVQEVAASLGGCATYDVTAVPSYQAVTELGEGAEPPQAWVPDHALWPDLAEGVELEPGPVLATSPVVLAGPAAYVDRLGDEAGEAGVAWTDLLDAPGRTLLVGDPTQDPASMASLVTVTTLLDGAATPEQQDALLVSLAQTSLEEDALQAAAGADELLVPASEQALATTDEPDLGLLTPQGGAGALTFSWVTVGDADEATRLLGEALETGESAELWREAGLRPASAPGEALVEGVPDDAPSEVPVEAGDTRTLLERWATVSPNSRMLVVIDVSGSMDDVVTEDGQSRFDLTMDASGYALQGLAPRTQIGLWWFSTERGPEGEDWVEALPVRAMEDTTEGVTHREQLLSITQSLDDEHTEGNTGLHDSLYAAYQHMLEDYDPDYRNSIVLLTDGRNYDPDGGLSQEEVVARLTEERDDERPVDVVIIGMGPEMEAEPMQTIVDSVGGAFRQVEEATDIQPVLVSIIASRDAT
jgi:Ca-activated chloride channel homolog